MLHLGKLMGPFLESRPASSEFRPIRGSNPPNAKKIVDQKFTDIFADCLDKADKLAAFPSRQL